MSQLLLIPAIFLVLLTSGIQLSNPESEIVQDSEEEVEGAASVPGPEFEILQDTSEVVQESGALRVAGSPEKIFGNLGRYPNQEDEPRLIVLKPVRTSTGMIYREVGAVYEGVNRMRDRGVVYSIYRGNRRPATAAANNNSNDRRQPVRGDNPQGGYRPPINVAPSVPEGGNRPSFDSRPKVPGGGYRPPFDNGSSVPQGGAAYGYSALNGITGGSNQGVKGNASANPVGAQPVPRGQTAETEVLINGRPASGATSKGGPSPANPKKGAVSPDINLFAGIINNFAFRLSEHLKPPSNFIFSPVSAFVAAAMCYLGSEGRTKAQLARAMGLDENSVHEEHLHNGIMDLFTSMGEDGSKKRLQLLIASGVFLAKNFSAEANFVDQAWRYYRSELHSLDFANSSQTLSTINQWVSRNTKDAIPFLMDRPPPPLTRMLLLSAVYFKGVWKTKFPRELTHNGRFHSSDGSTKEVPMMALYQQTFPFYRSDEHRHTFVKLPYASDLISMVIALPYSPGQEPLATSVRDLCYVLDAMRDTELERLHIPKFRIEDVSSLRQSLIQMGVSDIFDRQAVDLRKLRRQNDVYVSAIFQKALIEVDEQGTTAAAVTSVRFVPLTSRNPREFVADRPFAFYVIHEPSGLVLFFGKVNDLGTKVAEDSGNRGRMMPRPNSAPVEGSLSNDNDNNNNNNNNNSVTASSRIRIHGAVTYEDKERNV